MKSLFKIWFLSLSIFLSSNAYSQTFEITPVSGYTFPSSFDITGGEATIQGNINYGLFFGYTTPKNRTEFEISYVYFGSDAVASSDYLAEDIVSRANIHFVMGGINQLIAASRKTTFLAGVKFGISSLVFSEGTNTDRTKFTMGIQGGMKHYLSDRIGLRLQGSLLVPIVAEGGSLWWNPQTGTNISGWSPFVPVSLNGGLIIRIFQ